MDIVLGVSMAPSTVRMVLVEGENADGVTVEEDNFDLAASEVPTVSAADQVIAAILGTREGATAAGHQLTSAGVTWTDAADAAALRDALAARKIENVMLVSAFLAAAALAQTVGNAMGHEHTAMLFVEPDTATLAVVDACDGSVSDVYRRPLRSADVTAELAAMIADPGNLATGPEGLFIIGCGVDVAPIKPALEATTGLPVSAPEEPETALARGAALASANAPLFASSTAALAYAQDPGTGRIDPYAVAPGYLEMRTPAVDAYSAVTDDEGDAETEVFSHAGTLEEIREGRRPMLLIGSVLAVIFVTAALALEVALAIGIRPSAVALLPRPVQNLIVPTEQAPAPPVSTPAPPAMHMSVPEAPAPVHVVAPQLPAAPVPAPPPEAPAPIPAPAAPVPAPVLVPIPVHVPVPAPVHAPAPQPPVQLPIPQPPVRVPTPPVHVPTPPVQVPTPPVHVPTPPVQVPTPPVRVPTPPVHVPTPPVQVPAPPVQVPTPPVHVPTPPVQAPNPPIHVPTPPIQAPNPPINWGTPPVQVHAPQPPLNLSPPQPPIQLPVPAAPQMPAPRMPTMPAPQMPAPQMPAMPAPAMPRMPSMPAPAMPQMPSMPAPAMPHFNMPMPAFHF